MLAYLREYMARSASRLEPSYGLAVTGLTVNPDETYRHPVTVTLAHNRIHRPAFGGCEAG